MIFPLNLDPTTKVLAMGRARKEGTTLSAVLRAALDAYIGATPTARPPQQAPIPAPLGPPEPGKEQLTVWVSPPVKRWLKGQPGSLAEVVTRLVQQAAAKPPCPLGSTAACPGTKGACHGLEEDYQCAL